MLQEATKADIKLDTAASSGRDDDTKIGWLLGVPLAIKDLENVRGLPTTKGCPLFGEESCGEGEEESSYNFNGGWRFRNEVEDAPFVKRLRDAGAIIIGKTNGKYVYILVLRNIIQSKPDIYMLQFR